MFLAFCCYSLNELLNFLLEVPDDLGIFKIEKDQLIIEHEDMLISHIDQLVAQFEEVGKKDKI